MLFNSAKHPLTCCLCGKYVAFTTFNKFENFVYYFITISHNNFVLFIYILFHLLVLQIIICPWFLIHCSFPLFLFKFLIYCWFTWKRLLFWWCNLFSNSLLLVPLVILRILLFFFLFYILLQTLFFVAFAFLRWFWVVYTPPR